MPLWAVSRGSTVSCWASWGASWILAWGRGIARRVAGAIVTGAIRPVPWTSWASWVRGPGPVARGRSSWPRHPMSGVTRGQLGLTRGRGPSLGGGIAGGILARLAWRGRAIARVLASRSRPVVTPGIVGTSWTPVARSLLVAGVAVTIARLARLPRGPVTFVHVRGRAHVRLTRSRTIALRLGRAWRGHRAVHRSIAFTSSRGWTRRH